MDQFSSVGWVNFRAPRPPTRTVAEDFAADKALRGCEGGFQSHICTFACFHVLAFLMTQCIIESAEAAAAGDPESRRRGRSS
jgi:hypothetical protein